MGSASYEIAHMRRRYSALLVRTNVLYYFCCCRPKYNTDNSKDVQGRQIEPYFLVSLKKGFTPYCQNLQELLSRPSKKLSLLHLKFHSNCILAVDNWRFEFHVCACPWLINKFVLPVLQI